MNEKIKIFFVNASYLTFNFLLKHKLNCLKVFLHTNDEAPYIVYIYFIYNIEKLDEGFKEDSFITRYIKNQNIVQFHDRYT